MISVLVADDHGILRDALCFLLEAQGDIKVVGTAANGLEAVEQAIRLRPDVAIVDISMPVMDGLKAAREIAKQCPGTRIVMLTIYDSREFIDQAVSAGAHGYVLKDAAGRELVEAVHTLHEGGHYFSKKISD